jgi:L-cysteine desulfidase
MSFTVKDILSMEVAPALGCTEPAAIALAAAAAASLLAGEPVRCIAVWVDPNIYKNSLAVSIPSTGGLSGLDLAAALGALGGDAARRLQVLASVTPELLAQARRLIAAGGVSVHLLPEQKGLLIRALVQGARHQAEAVVQQSHDRIVSLSLDGTAVNDHPLLAATAAAGAGGDLEGLEAWLRELSLERLVALVDDLDAEDFAFLEEGVRVNRRLAEYGLKHGCGLGVGRTLERLARQRLIQRDMLLEARILTAAAADARMAGIALPAMSSAGSGNHGLTAILPIWAVKAHLACPHQAVLEAIALSHILTGFVKAFTGRLSALCGCSIAAGAGAAAGIAYLMGGTLSHIAGAIQNLTEDLAGVICDGAKAGCAFKLATAAGAAVQAALFALQGVQVHPSNGIIAPSAEQTLQNVGTLSTQGMLDTDRTILRIMMEKRLARPSG